MKLVPGRRYSFSELEKMRAAGVEVEPMTGYVWRMNLDGTMQVVHHTQATEGGGAFGTRPERAPRRFTSDGDSPFGELPAIQRRTPQQRLASLMDKVATDVRAGRVMTLDQINAHRPGRPEATDLSGEVVREAVQTFLEEAEVRNEAAERKKVVRTAPSD